MKFKRNAAALLTAALAAVSSGGASAAVVLDEGFDDFSALVGWAQVSTSGSAGAGWFQGNAGIFPAFSGGPSSYAAANFVDTVPSVLDWLMTPVLSLADTTTVTFRVRAAGADFLDTLDVFYSAAGASTSVADFTTVVGSYASSADEGWVARSFDISGAGSGRIGFRYTIADTSTAGNYLGLDDVRVDTRTGTPVSSPASLALAGLGLAALVATRRRR